MSLTPINTSPPQVTHSLMQAQDSIHRGKQERPGPQWHRSGSLEGRTLSRFHSALNHADRQECFFWLRTNLDF